MDSELISPSPAQGRAAARELISKTNVRWIVGEAIHDCRDLLRLRQQTITVNGLDLQPVDPSLQDSLARLLSLAIEEVSSVSCRRGVLSLGATGHAIVIQSNHPLDLVGQELTLDATLRSAASGLPCEIDMTWEPGRGPRLTLSFSAESKPPGCQRS